MMVLSGRLVAGKNEKTRCVAVLHVARYLGVVAVARRREFLHSTKSHHLSR